LSSAILFAIILLAHDQMHKLQLFTDKSDINSRTLPLLAFPSNPTFGTTNASILPFPKAGTGGLVFFFPSWQPYRNQKRQGRRDNFPLSHAEII